MTLPTHSILAHFHCIRFAAVLVNYVSFHRCINERFMHAANRCLNISQTEPNKQQQHTWTATLTLTTLCWKATSSYFQSTQYHHLATDGLNKQVDYHHRGPQCSAYFPDGASNRVQLRTKAYIYGSFPVNGRP